MNVDKNLKYCVLWQVVKVAHINEYESPNEKYWEIVEDCVIPSSEIFVKYLVPSIILYLQTFWYDIVSWFSVQNINGNERKNYRCEVEKVSQKHCKLIAKCQIAVRTPVWRLFKEIVVFWVDEASDQQVNV